MFYFQIMAISISTIDGCIQMKSYLKNPELRLALNEDLVIEKKGGTIRIGIGRRWKLQTVSTFESSRLSPLFHRTENSLS
jgi:hypothetical protein